MSSGSDLSIRSDDEKIFSIAGPDEDQDSCALKKCSRVVDVMPRSQHERRSNGASAEDVAQFEQQIWEFARRPDPPKVAEATLRPGAFLYRMHRVWHSLGRGSGLASHSFRALREELLKRDPPVRNLQPKLYGGTVLSQSDASHLIDVMLETWRVERDRSGGGWQASPLPRPAETGGEGASAGAQDLDVIRENLLHTLFKAEDSLLLEEPVGIPPEIFYEARGRTSLALIIPTKGETTAHLSPSNAYGGFSSGIGRFFKAAAEKHADRQSVPLLIWLLRLNVIRDNSEFHQAFHSLAVYSACLTNWYLRLGRRRGAERKEAQSYWHMILSHSAFAVYGLPDWSHVGPPVDDQSVDSPIDEDLADLDPNFFLPNPLPIALSNHRHVRRHSDHDFGLNVSIEPDAESVRPLGGRPSYWLFPDHPKGDLEETAETTGLPVFNAELSPGMDYDLAFCAIYEAVAFRLGFSNDARSRQSFNTLTTMGWRILTIEQFQKSLLVSKNFGGDCGD